MTAPELRRHQRLALDALARAWAEGRTRAWVELPPGAGKTRVGLEAARRLRAEGRCSRVVVLAPNTAIQTQWVDQAEASGLDAGTGRDLRSELTALTYQSLAVFDTEAEDPDEEEGGELGRLHGNGRALVETLEAAGDLLLILDESHHLLEVWGRLLGEVLDLLPRAHVLGLTATPPSTMTASQAELMGRLFGEVTFEASIPAVVREGDLAPFAELAWLVRPTAAETEWLDEGAERFRDLVTQLTAPEYGDLSLLAWLDARFTTGDFPRIAVEEPDLADAALRLHRAGLLALPDGARPGERHEQDPSADDWMLLVEDWLLEHIAPSEDPADQRLLESVRAVLPSVGYVWTRRGIRAGRSTVDRVLARSEAKTVAAVQIVQAEAMVLRERLRMLVLCDHEGASATLPAGLDDVLDRRAGSAVRVLEALLDDPGTACLNPLLVTGSTVAGAAPTLEALREVVAASDPGLAAQLVVIGEQPATLEGPWRSRDWVRHATRFFEEGRARVLVGTRGLLGEGWDARRVSGLVDLTAVTTSTAVVQTRGRALRIDPAWPEKVALTWSVVCVAPDHPRGGNDWDRLVRKHDGFFGVDESGDVVDGVAHLDPAFSPFHPPPVAEFDAVNARMLARAERRETIREQWRVGEEYDDRVARTLRLRPDPRRPVGSGSAAPTVVAHRASLEVREEPPASGRRPAQVAAGLIALLALLALGATVAMPAWWPVLAGLACVAAVAAGVLVVLGLAARGRARLAAAAEPVSVPRLAFAVADGLRAAGLTSEGSPRVDVRLDRDGVHRCVLTGVSEQESEVFVRALEEAVAPLTSPRYLLARWVVDAGDPPLRRALAAARGTVEPDGVVWHAVPRAAARNKQLATAYAEGWSRWLGGDGPVAAGSPEGAGALASQAGSDPLSLTAVVRSQWG